MHDALPIGHWRDILSKGASLLDKSFFFRTSCPPADLWRNLLANEKPRLPEECPPYADSQITKRQRRPIQKEQQHVLSTMLSKGLSAATLVALVATGVEGHGWMTLPRSRTEIACENREEYSPHGSLWDVEEGLAHIDDRGSPGRNPFSEPGLGVAAYGPCGKGRRGGGNDYNRPQMSWAGSNNTGRLVDTFTAGEIVKVEWMVKANHRGLYSYRLCANQTLVDPFLNGARAPVRAEYDALEACFQDGILPCNAPGLTNHACANSEIEPDCQPEWGCNNPEWFHMVPQQQNSDYLFVDYVKLPDNFVSDHTLMSFR